MSEQGNVEMVLGIEDGKVFQRFEHPMQTIVYDPENCIQVAMRLTDLAFEARDGLKPAGPTLKASLVERHRMTLTQRVAVMLNSLREDKRQSNGQVAQAVVEVMLREVF